MLSKVSRENLKSVLRNRLRGGSMIFEFGSRKTTDLLSKINTKPIFK